MGVVIDDVTLIPATITALVGAATATAGFIAGAHQKRRDFITHLQQQLETEHEQRIAEITRLEARIDAFNADKHAARFYVGSLIDHIWQRRDPPPPNPPEGYIPSPPPINPTPSPSKGAFSCGGHVAYEYQTQYTAVNYTPADQCQAAFGMPRRIEAITIHHWGPTGQSFEGIRDYLAGPNKRRVSAHYVVQDGLVACLVNPADVAWHAGAGRGNATTIGIELRPEATDGDYTTAAELIGELRGTYGDLPLIPHNHWAATECPGIWDLPRLDALARGTNPAPPPPPQPQPEGPRIQAPLPTPVNRYVTNPNAYVRTAPNTKAGIHAVFPAGTPIAVIGYVAGHDPYRTGDNAWYKTRSGFYLWANAAENNVNGLPYLGAI